MYGGPLICRGCPLLDDPPAHRARAAKRRWLKVLPTSGRKHVPHRQKVKSKNILCIFLFLLTIVTPDTSRTANTSHTNITRDLFHENSAQRRTHNANNNHKNDIRRCQHMGKIPRGIAQGARADAF